MSDASGSFIPIYSVLNCCNLCNFSFFQKITKDAGVKVTKATAPFTTVIQSYGYN